MVNMDTELRHGDSHLGFLQGATVAYYAGLERGQATSAQVPAGERVQAPLPYYAMPYGLPFFGLGFGPFACLIPFFLICLAFAALRGLMWSGRRGWGGHMRHGPWGTPGSLPPMFEEWHRRMHEQKGTAEDESNQ